MNYDPLWAAVDHMRRVADSIEAFIRHQESDPATPEKIDVPGYEQTAWSTAAEEMYRIEIYRRIEIAIKQARWMLLELSAKVGSRVTADDARMSRMAAMRCSEVLTELTNAGEL